MVIWMEYWVGQLVFLGFGFLDVQDVGVLGMELVQEVFGCGGMDVIGVEIDDVYVGICGGKLGKYIGCLWGCVVCQVVL